MLKKAVRKHWKQDHLHEELTGDCGVICYLEYMNIEKEG